MRLLPLLLILIPNVAAAEFFTLYNESKYGEMYADEREGGTITGAGWYDGSDGYAALWGPRGDIYEVVDGRLDVVSGPFISETHLGGDLYRSRFAAGGTVTADWVIAIGSGTRDVHFTAELGPFGLTYSNMGGIIYVPFQYGRFDEDSAALLGVPEHGLAGVWEIFLDHHPELDEGPDYRVFSLYGQIDATSVPEPGMALLLLAGLAARVRRGNLHPK
jgi:MYXO-CTERM domain-containing protein